MLQNYARKFGIAIDSLSFTFNVLASSDPKVCSSSCCHHIQNITTHPDDGVYIYGLYMEAGKWDAASQSIVEATPGDMYSVCVCNVSCYCQQMPIIHLKPAVDYVRDVTMYSCPLYKTAARAGVLSSMGHSTNFILAVDLPSALSPNHWVLQGTCLLGSIGDM